MAKILLAEDEQDIRELLTITLKLGGHDVTAKKNGAEVVEVAEEIDPDLVLLDVRMPRMTGYEACEAIKSNPRTQHIPVVFLSAKGQESEVKTGLEAGAIDYILKPFAPDLLLKRVTEILQELEQGRELRQPTAAKNHIKKDDAPPPKKKVEEKKPSTEGRMSVLDRLKRFERPKDENES